MPRAGGQDDAGDIDSFGEGVVGHLELYIGQSLHSHHKHFEL